MLKISNHKFSKSQVSIFQNFKFQIFHDLKFQKLRIQFQNLQFSKEKFKPQISLSKFQALIFEILNLKISNFKFQISIQNLKVSKSQNFTITTPIWISISKTTFSKYYKIDLVFRQNKNQFFLLTKADLN